MKLSNRFKLIKFIIAVLLFNTVMPTLASITSPDDKILVCTQNGFEWISVDHKQDKYLALAQQLNLDIEALFPELNDKPEASPPFGKCALCFFNHASLTALPSTELTIPLVQTKSIVFSFVPSCHLALGEYECAHPRAPPYSSNLT